MTESAVMVNGKPLREYLTNDIPKELAKKTQAELTRQEQQAADAATD